MAEDIRVPDLGGSDSVEVIEISVNVGDSVAEEDPILVLESDKATVELPAPKAGKITALNVSVGDRISEGDVVGQLEAGEGGDADDASDAAAPVEEKAPEAAAPAAEQPASGGVQDIKVPDLGGADSVEVIEISVSAGDSVEEEAPILVVESDKATVELPAPAAGTIKSISVKVGDRISEGDVVGQMEVSGGGAPAQSAPAAEAEKPAQASQPESAPAASGGVEDIKVPDLGGSASVEVIEISVSAGDQVAEEDPILVVESDKATVELPSPSAGTIKSISVKVGDSISEGDVVGQIEVSGGSTAQSAPAPSSSPESAPAPAAAKPTASPAPKPSGEPAAQPSKRVHAGPAVRRLARELGADLGRIQGSGPKNRILKEDVEAYVKRALSQVQEGGAPAAAGGAGLPAVKLPDFSQFGNIERVGMSRLMKLTADSMQRSWLNVPHVTQFEEADITEMEDFRKSMKKEGEKRGVKLTPMAFLLKICAKALEAHPNFNVSLDMEKKEIIQKRYIHIGIAVDTPDGLVVPVIRDVDRKGLWELAEECQVMAQKARDKKLGPKDMQGACFTITSLGGIGGTAFTPIVNTPEVAILGVSRSKMAPVWDGAAFQPRLMLPLSLSYDHRAINGADAARFTNTLRAGLEDLRQLLL
ncbi:dihydrolipoyllysine-residue acetyltransferase [Marinobacter halodurans]|uniref:Acetyltransferase component of pyruvate dehydrogenase complex n=1 Tax=Marinobacter halodurans TaxID=2528979 RepID=A0ABY1ZSA8_9GAMM|nr:dihydrolipoyllysine-residue acetyltransferase [Marinobacter halodurans]TBW59172.1 dihydrolipoyllysine-residue acetyltransferase [Marinobacter halodurans]